MSRYTDYYGNEICPSVKLIITHSAKGSTWKDHKYIRKENGVYVYAEDLKEKAKNTINKLKNRKTKKAIETGASVAQMVRTDVPATRKAIKKGYDAIERASYRANRDYYTKYAKLANLVEGGAVLANYSKDNHDYKKETGKEYATRKGYEAIDRASAKANRDIYNRITKVHNLVSAGGQLGEAVAASAKKKKKKS